MYKYINSTENMVNFLNSKSIYSNKLSELDEETLKMQNHLQNFCNPVQNIVQKEEGGLIEGWSLQGWCFISFIQEILLKVIDLVQRIHICFHFKM